MSFYNYTHGPFGQNSGHPVKDYVLNYDYSNDEADESEDSGTLETFRLAEDGFSLQEENCKPPQVSLEYTMCATHVDKNSVLILRRH